MNNVIKATISANREIAPGIFQMHVVCPPIASGFIPGQFAMLRTFDTGGGYLGRPFAISGRVDPDTFEVVYKTMGMGTRQISSLPPGTGLQVVGPLGNGFDQTLAKENALFVTGGMGVTPLLPLMEALHQKGVGCRIVIGAATRSALIGMERISKLQIPAFIATEDGSAGAKGYPTALIERELQKPADIIYACGPEPLIKALVRLNGEQRPLQISFERHMACGIGACTACALKTRANTGELVMKRVCKDGPVFFSREVVFDG